MTARTASAPAPLPRRQSFPVVTWIRSRLLTRWHDRYRQRCDLREIDDHLLRDIGLTRQDVRRECAKSFWQD
ncbi:DUF1127 domain-containing protein [Mesorhizobium sp. B2-3-4]|uniref:DUF1127 domain-containing protein n=1 Tax=Mesorhizobium sp. B2-3-4 TaxID=2589959 RepID=UPI001125C7CB|nr:DUF1127 domain-containing protein [Mesorhizobium sp. B2-3-4]TPM35584.1 DUF1127 domain-containing protein [Mesorhizobium sp. B2-3-4]